MSDVLAVRGVDVFTGRGDVLRKANVVCRDGRIHAVGRDAAIPSGATTIEGTGGFLSAGLIDAHSHLALLRVPERSELHPDVPFMAVAKAREKLLSGVTLVRDVGGIGHTDLALKRAIEQGWVLGPRMIAAGRPVTSTGGHVHYWAREADGPAEIRKAVREQLKAGAGLIKIMASGGIANVGERTERALLQPDEMEAAVNEAREAGVLVAAHAYAGRSIEVAVRAGVTSIEHGAYLSDEVIELLVRHRTWLVPTQAVYRRMADNVDGWPEDKARLARETLERKKPWLVKAIEAGVRIGVGTDSGRHYPAGGISGELAALVDAGMSPAATLLAATAGNAELCGVSAERGTVEPGKVADLVIFGGDVTADVSHAADVRLVILGGRVIAPDWGTPQPLAAPH